MTTENKTYNGWTNYETWAVNLQIDNDEGGYNHWRDRAEERYREQIGETPDREADTEAAASNLANELQRHYDMDSEIWDTVAGFYADLLNAALSEVNWDEIATAIVEGIDREGIEREEIEINREREESAERDAK